MRVIRNSLPAGARVVALGTFDGVHLGHARLIHSAKMLSANMDAPLRVCTFDRHPLDVLRPDNPPELLSTIPENIPARTSGANWQTRDMIQRILAFFLLSDCSAGV